MNAWAMIFFAGAWSCSALAAPPIPGAGREQDGLTAASGASATSGTAAAQQPATTPRSAPTPDVDADDESLEFDPSLLPHGRHSDLDLSRFAHADTVPPGVYYADVYLNQRWLGHFPVRLRATARSKTAAPCLLREQIERLSIDASTLPAASRKRLATLAGCTRIETVIPGAMARFQLGPQRLDISVPQALLRRTPRNYVPSEAWDTGINAAFVNYDLNTYRTENGMKALSQTYLGYDLGLNLGAWYFRHSGSLQWQNADGPHHQEIATYVQHALPAWQAQLTLGDSNTDGVVFDSFAVRGVQLATDDRMRPPSLRGFAPVVRGFAETNARVAVRQNGVLLYQTTVAPGPFRIDDLNPTGYGGDLVVTVTEADGRTRTFAVPYASVAQLLRPKMSRFSLVAGEVIDPLSGPGHLVLQATWQHGFSNRYTGYIGARASNGYQGGLLGLALNTRIGAFSASLGMARTELPGQGVAQGQSMSIAYAQTMAASATHFALAAYRYAGAAYYELREALQRRAYQANPSRLGVPDHSRSRLQLSVSQPIALLHGAFFLTGSSNSYWNRTDADTQYQAGFSGSWGRFNVSVSAARTRDLTGRWDTQFYLGLTLPLGHLSHSMLSANISHDALTGTQAQALLSGIAGANDEYSYGLNAARSGQSQSVGASGGYNSPFGSLSASAGWGSGYRQQSLGATGSVLGHSHGVVFGRRLGNTMGLVEAPDAAGARITQSAGLKIGKNGYALVPYLSPYQLNTISIDPAGLPLDVGFDDTQLRLAPYAGAVVKFAFKTNKARTAIIRARLSNGLPPPFGASVEDAHGKSVGAVAQGGRVFVRGIEPSGRLTVRWSDAAAEPRACVFDYALPEASARGSGSPAGLLYPRLNVVCRPTAASPTRPAARKSHDAS